MPSIGPLKLVNDPADGQPQTLEALGPPIGLAVQYELEASNSTVSPVQVGDLGALPVLGDLGALPALGEIVTLLGSVTSLLSEGTLPAVGDLGALPLLGDADGLLGGVLANLPVLGDIGSGGLPIVGDLGEGGLPILSDLGSGLPIVGGLGEGGLPILSDLGGLPGLGDLDNLL